MKELLLINGWIHYKTGCSCNASPRFFNNPLHPDYIVILRGTFFIIKKSGLEIAKGKSELFQSKLTQYGLITEN